MSAEDKRAKSPPGWKKTVERMKDDHDEIDNPFALAWWMHNKGYKPRKKDAAVTALYSRLDRRRTMHKIATTDDLQRELQRLLAYAKSEQPSRSVLASELQELSDRVAGSKRVAATIDLHSNLKRIVREGERAMAAEFTAALQNSVPYFRSNGLLLDMSKSWIDKHYKGSDGWVLTGELHVQDLPENTAKSSDWETMGKPDRAKESIRHWVEEACGIYTFPRKGSQPDEWICVIDES